MNNNKGIKRGLTVSLLCLTLTACGGSSGPSGPSAVPAATIVPTPIPTPVPIFSISGHGDNVFTVPEHVTILRIQGVWNGASTSNFIVHYRGRSIVNAILREAPAKTFVGVYAITGGGLIEIVSSGQITWTFTEQR